MSTPPSSTQQAFWEGGLPGRTQLVSTVVGSETAKAGHTLFLIENRIFIDDELARRWEVKRRYSDFHKLERALRDLGLPCPDLPPKQLWAFHTNSFILQRRLALNLWLQGTVAIWQSVSPTQQGAEEAYAIGEILEAFLGDPDTDSFSASLAELIHTKAASLHSANASVLSPGAPPPSQKPLSPPATSISAAPMSNNNNPNTNGAEYFTQGPSTGAGQDSITFAKIAQARKRESKVAGGGGGNAVQRRSSHEQTTGSTNNVAMLVSESQQKSASYVDLPTLRQQAAIDNNNNIPRVPINTGAAKHDDGNDDYRLSKSVPVATSSVVVDLMQQITVPVPHAVRMPSAGAVGIAINLQAQERPLTQSADQKRRDEYTTFDVQGNRVRHMFHPFTATVVYGQGQEGRNAAMESSGLLNAATPVSVPPTPHGQTEFYSSWSQYTSSVLEFVAERLDIVSRNARMKNERAFSILDKHQEPPKGGGSLGGGEDETDLGFNPTNNTGVAAATTTTSATTAPATAVTQAPNRAHIAQHFILNLRTPAQPQPPPTSSGPQTLEMDESADAGAGPGSANSQRVPMEARYLSYVAAGEHLVGTILRESEAAVDLVGVGDWELVSNTKDVIVMRRNRPIRRKYLLRRSDHPSGGGGGGGGSNSAPAATQGGSSSNHVIPSPSPGSLQVSPNFNGEGMSATTTGTAPIGGTLDQNAMTQHCWMGRGIINAPAEEVYELVRRPDQRHFYDSMLNEEITLENLQVSSVQPTTGSSPKAAGGVAGAGGSGKSFGTGRTSDLGGTTPQEGSNALTGGDKIGNLLVYYHLFETNRCFLRYARDFCVLQYAKVVTSNTNNNTTGLVHQQQQQTSSTATGSKSQPRMRYCVVGASVDHPDCPKRDDVERATLDLFGWVIEPIGPERSKVTYMISLDFGPGGVPTHLLNTISFRQPLCVAYLRRHLERLPPDQRMMTSKKAQQQQVVAAAAAVPVIGAPQQQSVGGGGGV